MSGELKAHFDTDGKPLLCWVSNNKNFVNANFTTVIYVRNYSDYKFVTEFQAAYKYAKPMTLEEVKQYILEE